MDKLVLIDGNSIAFRAFFALPLLKSRQGTYTNAVYGFTMMLMKVLEEEKPSHVLVAFDAGKFTFRHRDYKDYKGKRDKTPGEFSEQIPLIKRLLDAFGIRHFELEQYEADDIIGTLARQAEGAGIAVTIVTGDKDLLQLVSDRVHLLMTKKGVSDADRYDLHRIEERYGLKPEQIIDLKGLMGDPSDNIPGIPGVGEKTALKLLHQYGSVEKVLDNIDNLPGKKLKERVAENRRDALLSKELATIFCEVPLDFGINDLKYEGYDTGRVTPILKELEFKSLLERIGGSDAKEKPGETEEIAVEMVSPEETRNWDEWLSQDGLALFVEMSDENYHRAEVLAVALSDGKKQLFLEWGTAREWPSFRRWLQDPDRTKVCYDVKATGVALKHQGLETDGFAWDILLSSYLINASESGHELSEIVDRKWGGGLPDDDAVYGKGVKRRRPEGKELAEHLARKARAIHRLQPVLEEELKENGLDSLYFDLELPLARVLAKMEWQGVQVDRERLQSLGEELQVRLDELTEKIYDLAGAKFNINSPKQLGEILFDKLGLPVLKKTKTGYSTSADVLEKLAPQHEIVEEILHYRQVGKLISTYVEGLLKEIDGETGKIHTRFNQAITATGRLSSTDPNLQNIPIRLEEGRRIRQVFVSSEEEWLMLSADYSQIELRVLAHLSGDENLMEAFQKELDVHTKTAMDVFGVSADKVTPWMRRHAKAVNFGIVYGISDYGLSQNLNITRKEAGEFIQRYFDSYPGVKRYMEDIVRQAKKDGYVTTMLHRRRDLPEINSRNFNRRSFAERTAMNTPIQGTAADIIKKAMVEMDSMLEKEGFRARLLLQVHDELIFEAPAEEMEALDNLVRRVMENAVKLSVPLQVDINTGKTWYEAK
ncbi:DNA polymerase [Kroppenstedtia guangzhouensis]|uniref:DNA polymerase I n=1 Tax=Kroppenstedtia guangzhouensis TaxID=1274356 RepID=A0ABQ1GYJ7_9BACL|nr:DNA polymerase I [Kroppenstedtia guangzhouensis]GGA52872.1 DNA polymerase [Kroppenstedtia guangzhouensis]